MSKQWAVMQVVVLILAAAPAWAGEGRTVVSLDGEWAVAEGKMEVRPAAFDHKAPVPGMLDLATPAFEAPGVVVPLKKRTEALNYPADPRREAFWYRRTFKLDGPVPAVAMLKVHKALFGTKVWLNSKLVGEHWPCFTPGYFDLRSALKGGAQENELVIRVCSSAAPMPHNFLNGWDFEKKYYYPGIYDSVELILSGTPHVVNAQAVPQVEEKAVRVVAEIANAGPAERKAPIRLTVREAKGGKVVGEKSLDPVGVGAGRTEKIDATVPMRDARLWSPEDPFLYELTVDTGADRYTTRFALRSFHLDAKSGRAILNGKPYFLRGSNVCIFRFSEDAERGRLMWDEAWVRKLHRRFKDMHWNSLRYCIGWPPEMWYRIADEEGIMIQDEAPLWFNALPKTITAKDLAGEYTEWMRERWNHPCVVIWDAQNETPRSPQIAEAINLVRGLDLSNRPWENGWSEPAGPNDLIECHPYLAQQIARDGLVHMTKVNPKPKPNGFFKQEFPNAHLINEYGWLWINRDGTLPTLTVEVYAKILGRQATVEQRREYYARTLAAKTEFWRAHRKLAGVLHFCGLGYSREDGQTSDNFIDVKNLTFEPNFYKYVRDAFAPVGLMLDYWSQKVPAGEKRSMKVIAINDLDQPWKGTVRLRLMQGDRMLSEQVKDVTIPPLGESEVALDVAAPPEKGKYLLEAALVKEGEPPVRSLRDMPVE